MPGVDFRRARSVWWILSSGTVARAGAWQSAAGETITVVVSGAYPPALIAVRAAGGTLRTELAAMGDSDQSVREGMTETSSADTSFLRRMHHATAQPETPAKGSAR